MLGSFLYFNVIFSITCRFLISHMTQEIRVIDIQYNFFRMIAIIHHTTSCIKMRGSVGDLFWLRKQKKAHKHMTIVCHDEWRTYLFYQMMHLKIGIFCDQESTYFQLFTYVLLTWLWSLVIFILVALKLLHCL